MTLTTAGPVVRHLVSHRLVDLQSQDPQTIRFSPTRASQLARVWSFRGPGAIAANTSGLYALSFLAVIDTAFLGYTAGVNRVLGVSPGSAYPDRGRSAHTDRVLGVSPGSAYTDWGRSARTGLTPWRNTSTCRRTTTSPW